MHKPRSKVFGVGLNKTGTTTLGACLKILGYSHLSHSEDFTRLFSQGRKEELIEIAQRFDSFEDWPWPLLYKDLAINFPDAKFILTIRGSADTWLKSLSTHSYKLPPNENYHDLVYGYKYPLGHKKYHLDFYDNHNASVIEYFRDQPGRLLVVGWEKGDEWEKLCHFLGVAVPRVAFPHSGATNVWVVPRLRILTNALQAVKQIGARNDLKK